MIDKVKKTRFNVGDRVWINPQESEYGPFEAVIFKVEYNKFSNIIEYGIYELISDKLEYPSDGWTEEMLSICYPR